MKKQNIFFICKDCKEIYEIGDEDLFWCTKERHRLSHADKILEKAARKFTKQWEKRIYPKESCTLKSVIFLSILVILCLLVCAFGCSNFNLPKNQTQKRTSRLYVIGIDRTRSYKFMKGAIHFTTQLIDKAQPKDEFSIRWIGKRSYGYTSSIASFTIPSVSGCEDNPFDLKCKQKLKKMTIKLKGFKEEKKRFLINQIKKRDLRMDLRTDVKGFIQSASDIFEKSKKEKFLYIASDLKDNCDLSINPKLNNVNVIIFCFPTSDIPQKTIQIKGKWTKFFTEWGARGIKFLNIGEQNACK